MTSPTQTSNLMMSMFGNQPTMYPSLMSNMQQMRTRPSVGNMGQERSAEYTPIEGQPGYFMSPDGHRYKKKGPHYTPADPVGPNYYQQPRPAQRLPEWLEFSNPLDMVNPFRLLPGIIG